MRPNPVYASERGVFMHKKKTGPVTARSGSVGLVLGGHGGRRAGSQQAAGWRAQPHLFEQAKLSAHLDHGLQLHLGRQVAQSVAAVFDEAVARGACLLVVGANALEVLVDLVDALGRRTDELAERSRAPRRNLTLALRGRPWFRFISHMTSLSVWLGKTLSKNGHDVNRTPLFLALTGGLFFLFVSDVLSETSRTRHQKNAWRDVGHNAKRG